MKFPLAPRPFGGRVALSDEQCAHYERLAEDLVAATLLEMNQFTTTNNRVMDKSVWKPIKSRENLTVYKQTNARDKASSSTTWRMPKLVAVGTVAGTLEDMMYGIVTPDAQAIRVKTSYVQDELLDGAVLYEIQTPTTDDPFRFVSLKWIAMGHPLVVSAVVRPRDFVFVESTGIRALPDGTRVGFHAIHSVELPRCPELSDLGIVRARLSNCYLYRQKQPGVVEVYMTTYSDPGGNPPEKIATMSAANTLIGIWKAMWCAQNKKLTWLVTNNYAKQRMRSSSQAALLRRGEVIERCACVICRKTLSARRSVVACQLCSAWACSRCRVKRTLSAATAKLQLLQRDAEVCKRCITYVANYDPVRIARAQFVTPMAVRVADSDKPGAARADERKRDAREDDSDDGVPDGFREGSEFDSARTIYFPHAPSSPHGSEASVGSVGTSSEPDTVAAETVEEWGRSNRQLRGMTVDLEDGENDESVDDMLAHLMQSLGGRLLSPSEAQRKVMLYSGSVDF